MSPHTSQPLCLCELGAEPCVFSEQAGRLQPAAERGSVGPERANLLTFREKRGVATRAAQRQVKCRISTVIGVWVGIVGLRVGHVSRRIGHEAHWRWSIVPYVH